MIEETLAVQWRRLSNLWMGTLRSRPKLAPFELKKSVINKPPFSDFDLEVEFL